jgi:putative chitinase
MNIDFPRLLAVLAPHATDLGRACFANAAQILPQFDMDKPLRVAHFLSQVMVETGGLASPTLTERLHQVWKNRFPTVESAMPFGCVPHEDPAVRQGKLRIIANLVYGGRMGNLTPQDAYDYIGRGLLQPTGRDMYARVGKAIGVDLLGHPELACDPRYALEASCVIWSQVKKCNEPADEDNCVRITELINGGHEGLDMRLAKLAEAKLELGIA